VSALLVIFHPRRIPAAVASFDALDADIAYVSGGNESQACDMFADVLAGSDHDYLIVCADDCVITQSAFDAVVAALEDGVEVATGWCTLDKDNPLANVTDAPLDGDVPRAKAYSFMYAEDVRTQPERFETGFVGLGLTGMSRQLWERFPMACFGSEYHGWASDFHLSVRLRDAGIPMTAVREGFVHHLKQRWGRPDGDPEMRLLIGEIPREVIWRVRERSGE
jgi:GT2 family glycosyltransferase